MVRITLQTLVVEDDPVWQSRHKRKLEAFLGDGSVTVASTYEQALSFLESNGEFDAYIIDGEFPRSNGGYAEPLGLELALHVDGRKPGPKVIRLVSGNTALLDKAIARQIIAYTKGLAEPGKGYRDLSQLYKDVSVMLGVSEPGQT